MYTKTEMVRICKELNPTGTSFRVIPLVNAAMVDTSPDDPSTVMYFGYVTCEPGAAATFLGANIMLETPYWNSQSNGEQYGQYTGQVYKVFNAVNGGAIEFVGHKVVMTFPE